MKRIACLVALMAFGSSACARGYSFASTGTGCVGPLISHLGLGFCLVSKQAVTTNARAQA